MHIYWPQIYGSVTFLKGKTTLFLITIFEIYELVHDFYSERVSEKHKTYKDISVCSIYVYLYIPMYPVRYACFRLSECGCQGRVLEPHTPFKTSRLSQQPQRRLHRTWRTLSHSSPPLSISCPSKSSGTKRKVSAHGGGTAANAHHERGRGSRCRRGREEKRKEKNQYLA